MQKEKVTLGEWTAVAFFIGVLPVSAIAAIATVATTNSPTVVAYTGFSLAGLLGFGMLVCIVLIFKAKTQERSWK